jgi:hypothetical protein
MAFTDMYNKINANIKKYSTPKKRFEDEAQRRGWVQDYNVLLQNLNSAQWQRGQSVGNLRDDVTGAAYDAGNTRGSWGRDAFNKGMVGVDYAYRQNLQNIRNSMTGLENSIWAYNNRPSGGGGRRQRPNPPAAPTMQSANGPTVQRAIMDKRMYDPNTYEGQSTGLYAGQPKKPAKSQYQLRSREMY